MNPRRGPRAPARCRAVVAASTGSFEAETEDVGSHGCQVVSPVAVRKGDAVAVAITNGTLSDPLRVTGKVAWVSQRPPWRVGIAFDEASIEAGTRWFERLVAAHPRLGAFRRVPERIPVEATVYLAPPPRFLVDFTADEAAFLRAIASGVRIDELQARLRGRWAPAQRALFSLLARQAVTLVRGQAVHPDAWKRILADVEASLAVESLGAAPSTLAAPPEPPRRTATPVPMAPPATPFPALPSPTPVPEPARLATPVPGAVPPASRFGTAPQDPHPILELRDEGPSLDLAQPTPPAPAVAARGAGRATDAGGGWGGPGRAPPPDFAGAGVGWRARAPRIRPPEAQGLLDRARAEISAGNVNGAIALLRRALTLSPGDPEVADALGKLAFKDRDPESR